MSKIQRSIISNPIGVAPAVGVGCHSTPNRRSRPAQGSREPEFDENGSCIIPGHRGQETSTATACPNPFPWAATTIFLTSLLWEGRGGLVNTNNS